MKFYYNDKWVRTSKTRNYKYAVIVDNPDGTFGLVSCSETQANAQRSYFSYTRIWVNNEISARRAMSAIKEGKTTYINSHNEKATVTRTYEEYQEVVEEAQRYFHNTHIVALEARA